MKKRIGQWLIVAGAWLKGPDAPAVILGAVQYLADNGKEEQIHPTADAARDWLITSGAEPNTGVCVTRFVDGKAVDGIQPTFPIDPKGPLFPVEASAA